MKSSLIFASIGGFALYIAGCTRAQDGPADIGTNAHQSGRSNDAVEGNAASEREAAFSQLSAADRASAEAQGYCVVTSQPLGSMGAPLKVMVNNQVAWVCCKGCEKKAQSNPDQTLAKVAELQEKVKSERASNQSR